MGHHVKPGVATGKEVQAIFNLAKEKSFALPAVNVVGSNTINAVLETARDLNGEAHEGGVGVRGEHTNKLSHTHILGRSSSKLHRCNHT